MSRRLGNLALELWLPILLVAAWWLYSAANPSIYFPALADIVGAFGDNWLFERVGSDLVPSLVTLSAGLVIAAIAGISGGLALGSAGRLREALWPLIEFLRAIPGVAIVPIGLALLGIGSSYRIAVIAFVTTWPILLNTVDGVRGVDPVVRDVVRAFALRRRDVVLRVILPAASPQITAGVRLSLALGVSLVAFSEMFAATSGIGHFTLQAQRQFNITDMWSGMLLLGLLGYTLNVSFRAVEGRVLRWHNAMTNTQGL